jgi:hypothetical protein
MKYSYSSIKSKQDAYKKVCSVITEDYISQFKIKSEITYDESNFAIKANGKGFTLEIEFNDVECMVNLELSFLLRALKSKILNKVETELVKVL